jgi:hypothetical protein
MLPPLSPPVPPPPSAMLWGTIFVLLGISGIALMLFIWPKYLPTATPTFWKATVGLPLSVSALICLLRFWSHAGLIRDANTWDAVRSEYLDILNKKKSRPMYLLGASYRFSMDDEENAVSNVADGKLRVGPQLLPLSSSVVVARWFNDPGGFHSQIPRERDAGRQEALLTGLIQSLISPLLVAIQGLPAKLPLHVSIQLACPDLGSKVGEIFRQIWADLEVPKSAEISERPVHLTSIETWLGDDSDDGQHATLLVTIELRSLYSRSPPDQSAEVGAALLVVTENVALTHGLDSEAHIYRPAEGTLSTLAETVDTALFWAGLKATEIGHLWYSGFGKNAKDSFLVEMAGSGIKTLSAESSNEHDLDMVIGRSGLVADWLALVCACKFSQFMGNPQLVARFDGSKTAMCAIRPVERAYSSVSS